MLKNYIKIAWRNAIEQKRFTILNVLGLTVGITVCFVIGLYVFNEMTYDTFHDKGDRIYRINQSDIWGDWNGKMSNTGPNVAVALREDIPEFEEVTRLLTIGTQTVSYQLGNGTSNSFREERFFAAEENFFDVFSFKSYKGDVKTALKEPLGIIMTRETAERYFTDADNAIGKTIEVKGENGDWSTFTVKAVLTNLPKKSHLQFDFLVSLNSQESLKGSEWMWIWTGFSTYGLVNKGTDIAQLTNKLQAIPPKWAPATTKKVFNQSYEEFTSGNPWQLFLQPLEQIYLSEAPDTHLFGPTGRPRSVKIFSIVGILVLVLSAINFMNLSTAQSTKRAKEVGVQKALGSGKKTLIIQFITESVLYVTISTILAILLVLVSLDTFEAVIGKELELMAYITNPVFLVTLLVFILLLGLLSGSYPAFYLSAFKPVEVLKGKLDRGLGGERIRNGLVVFQFTITIILIVCAFLVQKQLAFASSYDIGFSKQNLLQIHNIEQLEDKKEVFKSKLLSNSAFSKVGESFDLPPHIGFGGQFKASGGVENPIVALNNLRTEEDYLDVLGIEFIEGRNFDKQRVNDKYKIILNEEAVKMLGWGTKETFATDSPIGKKLTLVSGERVEFEVIGVVGNFNFNSVKKEIAPLIILHYQNDKFWNYKVGKSTYAVRLNTESVKGAESLQLLISKAKESLSEVSTSVPFEYSFLDQEFEKTFRSEQQMGAVLNLLTPLTLLIACLGLIGLAAFSAEKRHKEIGVRKTLGQDKKQIVFLLSGEFTKLVGVAILIGLPIAFLVSRHWLSGFAYRIDLKIWYFLFTGVITLLIALATVSLQAIRAANKNPIDALKTE
ncbi:FtsX-like permease family protein [Flavobacteriaceae bacterium R38]|nr:FtsX-like permease family protein [Flavobacteriaceae bacterium R38]